MMNPIEYVSAEVQGQKTEKMSPIAVVEYLRKASLNAVDGSKEMKRSEGISEESKALLSDIEAMGYLGYYYADKIEAAVSLAYYRQTADEKYKTMAVAQLESALRYWIHYAEISEQQYKPQMLARTNILDWQALINEAKEDINIAKNYQL